MSSSLSGFSAWRMIRIRRGGSIAGASAGLASTRCGSNELRQSRRAGRTKRFIAEILPLLLQLRLGFDFRDMPISESGLDPACRPLFVCFVNQHDVLRN